MTLDSSTILWLVAELVIVGVIAARLRIRAILLAVLVAAGSIYWVNLTSPFRWLHVSYFSPLAITSFISWLIFIAIVRYFISPYRVRPSVADETSSPPTC